MATNSPPRDSGHLDLVWQSDPSVCVTTVDIVAVHGLGTYSPKTWEAYNVDSSKPNVNWLKDSNMLPSVIPNARILTFDYDADCHNDAPVTSLLALGDKLLQIVGNYRTKDNTIRRPLIFIGSCFGGLVVVQALNNAAQSSNPHYELFRLTVGVVFLGTPLQGTKVACLETWRVMIEGILGKDSSPSLIKDLGENSRDLRNLTGNFAQIAVNNSLKIHCLYETKKTAILKAIFPQFTTRLLPSSNVILVEKDNAHILGHPNTAIDVSHTMMNKFRSPTDRGFELVSSCIRNFVESTSQPLEADGSLDTLVPWTVPFARDCNFIGREDIIDKVLKAMTILDWHSRMALTGFGGIGKTGIANEFAFKLRELHPKIAVLWVYATSRDRFEESFRLIAEAFEIPGRTDKELDVLYIVDAWLKRPTTGQWIIILDNADDPKVLKSTSSSSYPENSSDQRPLIDFIPQSTNGGVLVTSRNRQAARDICGNSTLLDVEKMKSSDAKLLLQKKLPQDNVGNARARKFAKLAEELDCIPLAMIHAAAYMTREDITTETYLELLEQSRTAVLSQQLDDLWRDTRIPHSVISTWHVSFQQIQAYNPQAIELLFLMSLLDRQSIADNLVKEGFLKGLYSEDVNEKMKMLPDQWTLQRYVEASGLLLAYGFISSIKTGESRCFYMHRLIQVCVQHWMATNEEKIAWEMRALKLLANSFPSGHLESWPKSGEILPHAHQLMRSTTDSKYDCPGKAQLLRKIGFYELKQGHIKVAAKYVTESVVMLQKLDHDDILESQFVVTKLLVEKGQYPAAEHLVRKIIEEATSSDLVASSGLVLVSAMRKQGKAKEAVRILQPLVEAAESELGLESSFTLRCLQDLSDCLGDLEQYEAQESILRRTLTAREKLFGREHLSTFLTLRDLAYALRKQGNYMGATSFYEEAFIGSRKVFGLVHDETLDFGSGLAGCLMILGRFKDAEELYSQISKADDVFFGPDHTKTLATMDLFAFSKSSQGHHEQAKMLREEILIRREKKLGLDHADALMSAHYLACELKKTGEINRAVDVFQRVWTTRKNFLGLHHELTLFSLRHLAEALTDQGNYVEAEKIFQDALTRNERVNILVHANTLWALKGLAQLKEILGEKGRSKSNPGGIGPEGRDHYEDLT